MSLRWRLVVTFSLVSVLCTAVIGWKISDLFSSQYAEEIFSIAERQADLAGELFKQKSAYVKDSMLHLYAAESSERNKDVKSGLSLARSKGFSASPYLLLGRVDQDEQGQWGFSWVAAGSGALTWPLSLLAKTLKSLPIARIESSGELLNWSKVETPTGQPAIAVVTQATVLHEGQPSKEIIFGLLPMNYFAQISGLYKGEGDSLFVVDDQGYTLAYPSQQYLGTRMQEIPLVKSALAVSEGQVMEEGEDMFGRHAAVVFSKIAGTNLRMISTTGLYPIRNLVRNAWGQAVAIGLAIFLLFCSVALWMVRPWELALTYLRKSLLDLSKGESVRPAGQLLPELVESTEAMETLFARLSSGQGEAVEPSAPTVDPMLGFKQVGSGLVDALKGPVTAILGHIQLAKSKGRAGHYDQVVQHYSVIEHEARQIRHVIDGLNHLTGEDELALNQVDLTEIVTAALTENQSDLSKYAIKVEKQLQDSIMVMAEAPLLQQVFCEVIKNAIDAVKDRTDAKIVVSSKVVDKICQVQIEDNGAGIPSDKVSKIFSPFYSSQLGSEQAGLGLAVALGVMSKMNGKIFVQPDRASGTAMVVELPKLAAVHVEPEEAAAAVTATATDVAASEGITEDSLLEDSFLELNPSDISAELNLEELVEEALGFEEVSLSESAMAAGQRYDLPAEEPTEEPMVEITKTDIKELDLSEFEQQVGGGDIDFEIRAPKVRIENQ